MNILDVPTTSISEVKCSPMSVFARSRETENGVYVLSRGTVAGVMLTQAQYESLNRRIDELEEELVVREAALRIGKGSEQAFRDDEVRDEQARATTFSDNDGWE